MPIDPRRLIATFERFGEIGIGPGSGVTRLALSPQDHKARALFVALLREAGISVRIDRYGNIWGRTDDDWDTPAVVTGSHLDSVPDGGRYDGVVGVVAALEVIRSIGEQKNRTKVPIGVVDFAAEESSRFGVSTVGSRGVAALLSYESIMQLCDRNGISYIYHSQAQSNPSRHRVPAFYAIPRTIVRLRRSYGMGCIDGQSGWAVGGLLAFVNGVVPGYLGSC